MSPLQENIKENAFPPLSESKEDIVVRLQGTKDLVDEAIGKMRENKEYLREIRRKTDEIVKLCEESGNDEIVKMGQIIGETGDINTVNWQGWPLSIILASLDFTDILKILAHHPEFLVNKVNRFGKTAFMAACEFTNKRVVKFFLDHPDILVNEKSDTGDTAFLLAVENGKVDIVETLLEDTRLDLKKHDQGEKGLRWSEKLGPYETHSLIKKRILKDRITSIIRSIPYIGKIY